MHIDRDGKALKLDRDVAIMEKWLQRIRNVSLSYSSMNFVFFNYHSMKKKIYQIKFELFLKYPHEILIL